jgi:hypothetical protein
MRRNFAEQIIVKPIVTASSLPLGEPMPEIDPRPVIAADALLACQNAPRPKKINSGFVKLRKGCPIEIRGAFHSLVHFVSLDQVCNNRVIGASQELIGIFSGSSDGGRDKFDPCLNFSTRERESGL